MDIDDVCTVNNDGDDNGFYVEVNNDDDVSTDEDTSDEEVESDNDSEDKIFTDFERDDIRHKPLHKGTNVTVSVALLYVLDIYKDNRLSKKALYIILKMTHKLLPKPNFYSEMNTFY